MPFECQTATSLFFVVAELIYLRAFHLQPDGKNRQLVRRKCSHPRLQGHLHFKHNEK